MGALSGELTIDLAAIRRNYHILDEKVGARCVVAPSVKANAYGLGAAHVVPALYEAGARAFFVATIEEGVALRAVAPDANICILNGFAPRASGEYRAHNLTPVLNSLHDIAAYQDYATQGGGACSAVLHFDTGMNRLGISSDEAETLFDDQSILAGLDVQCVMSHFSSSEDTKTPINAQQFARFQTIMAHFSDTQFSMCNSGGVFLSPDYHLDLVRPGIALYGGNPTDGLDENPMNPVVSLNVPVLQIHAVKKGETAGYNGTHRFHKNGHVAIMSIGYADGLFRALSNSGALYWQGCKMPICGRVSMDLVVCDLSAVPEDQYPNIGDRAEVIGVHQTIDDLAHSAGTISYEILTALGARYRRVYL